MYSLFRAEWRKIGGNYPVMYFLVWIFPIGAAIAMLVFLLIAQSVPARGATSGDLGMVTWDSSMVSTWYVASGQLGRLLGLAFTSVVFAGEYQWGTWKNILTRSNRLRLLVAKFGTICAFMLTTFGLMSVVLLLGGAAYSLSRGLPYGAFDGDTILNFAAQYSFGALIAVLVILVGAGYAAVASIFSRSILGGVIVGVAVMFVEGLSPLLLLTLGRLINQPQIAVLYQLLPSYNIDNISSWILTGRAASIPSMIRYADPNSLGLSVLIVALWVVGLMSLTFYLFQRQDITT